MNHHIVTRVVISITVLFVSAALSFAGLRAAQPGAGSAPAAAAAAPHPGAALFKSQCSACHEAAKIAAPLRGSSAEAQAGRMTEFLRKHGKASDAQDLVIVDYLKEQARTAP